MISLTIGLAAITAAQTTATPAVQTLPSDKEKPPIERSGQVSRPLPSRDAQPTVTMPTDKGAPPSWRTRLSANTGIDLTLSYASESAASVDGGRERGTAYTQQVLGSVSVDTAKAIGLPGGRFVATVIHRTGVDLTTTRIGNLFQVQELWGGGGDFRPAEITYEQKSARTSVKVGLFHTGDDFATLTTACNFQSFAFCPRPTSLFLNTAFSGFPIPRYGIRLRQEVAPGVFLSTAVMEVNGFRARTGHGFDLAPRFDSYVFPLEVSWKSGQQPGERPGFVRLGGIIDTTDRPDVYRDAEGGSYTLSGSPPVLRGERWTAWLLAEKMVRRFGDGTRGLTVFGDVTFSDRGTARVPFFLSGGLVARGASSARPADGIGFGIAAARVNPGITRRQREAISLVQPSSIQTWEVSAEAFYAFQVTSKALLRPNVQYIHRVGATSQYGDATVLGLTVRIAA